MPVLKRYNCKELPASNCGFPTFAIQHKPAMFKLGLGYSGKPNTTQIPVQGM